MFWDKWGGTAAPNAPFSVDWPKTPTDPQLGGHCPPISLGRWAPTAATERKHESRATEATKAVAWPTAASHLLVMAAEGRYLSLGAERGNIVTVTTILVLHVGMTVQLSVGPTDSTDGLPELGGTDFEYKP